MNFARCATASQTECLHLPAPRRRRAPVGRPLPWRPQPPAPGKPLVCLLDHGPPATLGGDRFLPGNERNWDRFAEAFLRLNEPALAALDVRTEVAAERERVVLRLVPGARAGAMPLRSPQTGRVEGGVLVIPRFEWDGVGAVLEATGWHASPEFHAGPLVPGSAKQVPTWVIAGPVIARIAALLRTLRRGYEEREEILSTPRGTIDWTRYAATSLSRGEWHRLPCRYPDLTRDPKLRSYARWTLEHIHADLARVAPAQAVVRALVQQANRLLIDLRDVPSLLPSAQALGRMLRGATLGGNSLIDGLQAIGWVADERGLGGEARSDGLAWHLALDRLWESYVEAIVRREAALEGGEVRVGRLGETTFPLQWSDRSQRSLGSLVPDIVVRRGGSVHVVDAKYKGHLAELDEDGWRRLELDVREAHRADVHQVLAYAALYDAVDVKATLVYPLRPATFTRLHAQGRDRSTADLLHGGRRVSLELRGVPFGAAGGAPRCKS